MARRRSSTEKEKAGQRREIDRSAKPNTVLTTAAGEKNVDQKGKDSTPAPKHIGRLPWSPIIAGKASSVPLVFTRDGEFFFVAASSAIRVYSTSTGRLISTLSSSPHASTSYTDDGQDSAAPHAAAITGLLLNPNNAAQLISSSLDGTVKIWDFLDGHLLRTLQLRFPVTHMVAHHTLKGHVLVSVKKSGDTKKSGSSTKADPARKDSAPKSIVMSVALMSKSEKGALAKPKADRLATVHNIADLAISSDGRYVVIAGKRKIYVVKLGHHEEKVAKIWSENPITRIVFHPTNNTFATGHQNGQIRIWYFLAEEQQINHLTSEPQLAPNTLLHWHAHGVSALRYSDNGALLLSGGEESVLVVWQLASQGREYIPRLGGSTIMSISMLQGNLSRTDQLVAAMADGSVAFISTVNLKPLRTLVGILSSSSGRPGMASLEGSTLPLAVQPKTNFLVVSAGHPSTLQFLDAESEEQVMQLEVIPSNRVSRPDDAPLDQPHVECVCFTAQGDWMATVDRMPSGESSLKIWSWDEKEKGYEVNTRIDQPHGADAHVLGMAFSPRSYASIGSPLLVTYGSDNKCRAWRSVFREVKRKQERYWVARSAFDHRGQRPSAVAWSDDGSLLAVVHDSATTLWEPERNVLLHVIPHPHSVDANGSNGQVGFTGNGGRFLVIAVNRTLSVFDIVLGTLTYDIGTKDVVGLIPLRSDDDDDDADFGLISTSSKGASVVSLYATTRAETKRSYELPFGVLQASPIRAHGHLLFYALTKDYDVVRIGSDPKIARQGSQAQTLQHLAESRRRTIFDELLGPREDDSGLRNNAATRSVDVSVANNASGGATDASKLFDMPSHLLPPVHLLFDSFVKAVLPPRKPVDQARADADEGVESENEEGDKDESMGLPVDGTVDTTAHRMARIAEMDMSGMTDMFARLATVQGAKESGATLMKENTSNGSAAKTNGTLTPRGKDAEVSGSAATASPTSTQKKARRRSSGHATTSSKDNVQSPLVATAAVNGGPGKATRKRKISGA